MTSEKFIELCCEVCEDNDGYVAIDGARVEIRKSFREDKEYFFPICFDGKRDPLEQVKYEYYDFNPDERAAQWYEQNKNEHVSITLREWIDFAEAIEYMLEQLWNTLLYAESEDKRENTGETA